MKEVKQKDNAVICPECGNAFFESEGKCPKCGTPYEKEGANEFEEVVNENFREVNDVARKKHLNLNISY